MPAVPGMLAVTAMVVAGVGVFVVPAVSVVGLYGVPGVIVPALAMCLVPVIGVSTVIVRGLRRFVPIHGAPSSRSWYRAGQPVRRCIDLNTDTPQGYLG